MPRYKRTLDDAELDLPSLEPEVPEEKQEMLSQLRSMWEFASLMQYIFLFGKVVKIDENFDIEVWTPPSGRRGYAKRVGMCLMMSTDDLSMAGPRARVFEATAVRQACADRAGLPQIRLVSPRTNVWTLLYGALLNTGRSY